MQTKRGPKTGDTMLDAFSTPIFIRSGVGGPALNDTLCGMVRQLAAEGKSDDTYRAHQGGFYTPGTLFDMDLPGLSEIKPIISEAVLDYIGLVTGDRNRPRKITIIGWAALTRERDYQTPHLHAGSTLSGVYYAEVPDRPEPEGGIDFMTPIDLKEMTFLQGDSNTHCRYMPKSGDLVLFPSYLKHYTHPFFGPGERIAIVFNVGVIREKRS